MRERVPMLRELERALSARRLLLRLERLQPVAPLPPRARREPGAEAVDPAGPHR